MWLALSLLLSQAAPTEFETYVVAAKRLLEATEYEKALAQLSHARGLTKSPADIVRVELLEGVLQGELGKADKAKQAFRTALALDLAAQLPVKVSKKLQAVFDTERAALDHAQPTTPSPAPTTTPTPTTTTVLPVPVEPPTTLVVSPPPHHSTPRALGVPIGLAVLAGALGVTGGITFGFSRSQAVAALGALYDADARRLGGSANLLGTVSLISAITAGLAAVASVGLFALTPEPSP